MLRIKTLYLNNWGTYEGHHQIEFDNKFDIFCVHGRNGAGKGHFVSAVTFLIYGFVKANKNSIAQTPDGIGDNHFELIESYLNENALDEGQDFWVRAKFYDKIKSKTYDIRKDILVTDRKVVDVSPKYNIFGKDNIEEELPNLEKKNIIKDIFKPGLREYFFVDGEGFRSRGEKVTKNQRKRTIEDICGLEKLGVAKRLIEEKREEVAKKVDKESKALKLDESARKEYQSTHLAIEENQNTLNQKEKNLELVQKNLKEQYEYLEKYDEAKKILEDIDIQDTKIKDIEEKIKQNITRANENQKDLWKSNAYDSILPKIDVGDIDREEINNQNAVRNLSQFQNENSKIYNSSTQEFKKELKDILKLNQDLLNKEINNKAVNLYNKLTPYGDVPKKNSEDIFSNLISQYKLLEEKKELKQKTMYDLDAHFSSTSAKKDTQELRDNIEKYKNNLKDKDKYEKQITECKRKLEKLNNDLKKTKKRFSDPAIKDLQLKEDIYEEFEEILTGIFSKLSNPIKEDLQKDVEKQWKSLLRDSKKDNLSATFTEDYTLKPSVMASTGEKQLLEYSLTAVLARRLKSLPLFLDAPYADLDDDSKEKVTKTWSTFEQQLVIFNHPEEKEGGAFNKENLHKLLNEKNIKHFEITEEKGKTKIIQNSLEV